MATTKAIVKWLDADGQKASNTVYFDGAVTDVSASPVTDLLTALESMSTAKIVTIVLNASDSDVIGTAASNAYDIQDKLKVFGRSTAGEEVETTVPAPLSTAFEADKETLNLGSGAGATFKAALEAVWKGQSGAAVTVYKAVRFRYGRKA